MVVVVCYSYNIGVVRERDAVAVAEEAAAQGGDGGWVERGATRDKDKSVRAGSWKVGDGGGRRRVAVSHGV